MKKNILAIAIASAVAAPVAMADAPTVYGQINVAIDSVDVDKGSSGMDVVSRNSRLGFKGSEDLGNGLKAIYQYEVQMDPVNTAGDWRMRNSFVGLGGGFGTVVMGRHDTPLRMIQPKDGFADSAYAGNNTSKFNGNLKGEDRLDEVVAYMSPDFNGIKFMAAVTGQNSLVGVDETTAAGEVEEQAITNAMSAALTYGSKKSGIYAAVAMVTGDKQDGAEADASATPPTTVASEKDFNNRTRATVQYNEGGLLASFMYNAEADAGTSMTLGAAYKMGQLTPRAKVSMVSFDDKGLGLAATDEDSVTNMAAGVDYHLGKKTRVYAEYAALGDGWDRGKKTATTVMSVGLFHKF